MDSCAETGTDGKLVSGADSFELETEDPLGTAGTYGGLGPGWGLGLGCGWGLRVFVDGGDRMLSVALLCYPCGPFGCGVVMGLL